MTERTLTIINNLGLHARAAAKFVTTASQFKSEIQVSSNGRTANGKSIMGIIMLAAAKNIEIKINASGKDEQQALDAIETLINDFFGEGE